MQSPQAKSVVIGCVLGAGVIGSVSSIADGRPPQLRTVVGVFVAGGLLLALAEASPELAAGFGGLVLVGSVLRDGIPAAKKIEKALG